MIEVYILSGVVLILGIGYLIGTAQLYKGISDQFKIHEWSQEQLKILYNQKVGTNRKNCEYRHENGNCLKVGGFCTSVDNKHCVKGGNSEYFGGELYEGEFENR